jgi:ribose transport system substrate-binding protein
MNIKRLLVLVLVVIFISVSFLGCNRAAENNDSTADTKVDVSDQEYVYLTVVSSVPYWVDTKEGLEKASEYLGVKTTFMGPADFDVNAQVKMMDDLIAKKPAGIIVFAADVAITDAINRAVEAGIPVICDNSDAPDSKRLTWTGFDGYGAGQVGAEVMAELLGGKGKVIIGGFPSGNVLDRMNGYEDTFKEKYPDIEVVATVNDFADPSKAPEVYSQALAAHPDVDGIVGTDGDSGKGIATALVSAGKAGQVKVVAMDRNDDMLPFIKDGTINASIADKAYMNAFLAVNLLYWQHNGIMNPIEGWKDLGINILPNRCDSGVMVINKDNVDQFFHKKQD